MKKLGVLLLQLIVFQGYAQTWNWVDRVAGNGNNYVFTVEVDEQEKMVYSTGRVKGTGLFGEISTPVSTIQYGDRDVFLTKHDIEGNLIWVKRFGGTFTDWGTSIELTPNDIYLTGYFTDTVIIDNTDTLISVGMQDIFILKLDNNGNIIWHKSFGGPGNDQTTESEIDDNGNLFIVGTFEDSIDIDGNILVNTLNPVSYPFTTAAFIIRMDDNGDVVWTRKQQSTRDIVHNDLVYKDGYVYIVGVYNGIAEFYPTATLVMNTGFWQSSLMKISDSGNLIWVQGYGGSNNDILAALDFDEHNFIYSSGTYRGNSTYQTETFSSPSTYLNNGMVVKFDTSGNVLNITDFPCKADGKMEAIEVVDNRVYAGGHFSDSLFINGDTVLSNGLYDILLVGLDTGLNFLWSTNQGGASYDQIRNLEAFNDHTIVFGGSIKNTVVFPTITFTTQINTYDGIMGTVTPPLEAFLVESDTHFCAGEFITIYNTSIGHEDTAIWNSDGLPVVFASNDSLILSASTAGVYHIKMLVSNLTEEDSTLSQSIEIFESATLDLGTDTVSACINETAELIASGNYDALLWSTAESADTIYVPGSGWYYAEASVLSQCPAFDSVYAAINLPLPLVEILEDSILACDGTLVELNATGVFDSITWSSSEMTATIFVSGSGWFFANGFNNFDCINIDSVWVEFVSCLGLESYESDDIQLLIQGQNLTILSDHLLNTFVVYDMSGRIMDNGSVLNNQVNFNSYLAPGQYVIVFDNGMRSKFIIWNE